MTTHIPTQAKVDAFIEHLKEIKWFQPSPDLDKAKAEEQIKFALSCFGVTAEIEWRKLNTEKDWASARASARDSARASAWDSARDSAWASARDSARASARASAWASAWASCEILVEDLPSFSAKYPHGAFRQLMPLWEMGLYPVGIANGKFIICVPPCSHEFPKCFND